MAATVSLQREFGRRGTRLDRAALRARIADRVAPLYDSTSGWAALPTAPRRLTDLAQACVDLYHRASSCAEGRNGVLSLRHHHLYVLATALLRALSVVHNYVLRRAEGTRAALRRPVRTPLHGHAAPRTPLPPRP